jgi:ABC-type transporter Mla subunit MlaD
MEQVQSEVREFFKTNPGQIRDLLTQARGKSPTILRETQQFLGALAQGDPEFQNIIREIELELELHNI